MIELLVVISIIALLIGILLPALSAARGSAQDIQCLSNIRQIATATVAYATDNGDHYIHYKKFLTNAPFHGSVPTAPDGWWWPAKYQKDNYLPGISFFTCPVLQPTSDQFLQAGVATPGQMKSPLWHQVHYGMNTFIGTMLPNPSSSTVSANRDLAAQSPKTSDLKNTTETVAFTDSVHGVRKLQNNIIQGISYLWPGQDAPQLQYGQADGRHNGGAINVSWADGHGTREIATATVTAPGGVELPNPYTEDVLTDWYLSPNDNKWDRK